MSDCRYYRDLETGTRKATARSIKRVVKRDLLAGISTFSRPAQIHADMSSERGLRAIRLHRSIPDLAGSKGLFGDAIQEYVACMPVPSDPPALASASGVDESEDSCVDAIKARDYMPDDGTGEVQVSHRSRLDPLFGSYAVFLRSGESKTSIWHRWTRANTVDSTAPIVT